MLKNIYPQDHARFSALPLLGRHVDGFVAWLYAHGYPSLPIRLRIRQFPRVDELLRKRAACQIKDLTASDLLSLSPKNKKGQAAKYVGTVLRSLSRYFASKHYLAEPRKTPTEKLVGEYQNYLDRVRGLAEKTQAYHRATAVELLTFLGFDRDPTRLHELGAREIEAIIKKMGLRLCRASLQHCVGHLRSFLRFLASRRLVAFGLGADIDTPRVYRGERLPRALSWDVVRRFLAAIDRSRPVGKRDYAMFMLIATYGLRTSEVAALQLDDIEWRAGRLRVPRPKVNSPLVLPLTEEVGAALIDYLRHARPQLSYREVFLRLRALDGPIGPTAVSEAFHRWTIRSGLSIPYRGPHCLRHSLAVELLRQGTSLKAIGDLLGHRSLESTSVYLRLSIDDLRDVGLDLPSEVRS